MARVLIVGDSQGGNPGRAAEEKLRAAGHEVRRVYNVGMGPYDYVRMPALWAEYTDAVRSFSPDMILLIFGSNDSPGPRLEQALAKMKRSVRPKVILSGPPQYPREESQARGQELRALYARVFGDDFIDAYPYTPLELQRDRAGFHFTRESAKGWGYAMADEVVRRLGARPLVEGPSGRGGRSGPGTGSGCRRRRVGR